MTSVSVRVSMSSMLKHKDSNQIDEEASHRHG